MTATVDELLQIRATMAQALGGPHPSLTLLDLIIARQMKVNVFDRATSGILLADVFGHGIDHQQLSHLIDQLTRAHVATAGGGSETPWIVERSE